MINRRMEYNERMTSPETILTFYGADWCGSSRSARLFLEQNHVPYRWVDVDQDESAARTLEGLTGGYRSVPTFVLPDGSVLVEPSRDLLAKKLGLTLP